MIIVEENIDFPDTYPLKRLGELEQLLFFDIETTGFSGDYSNLYLIGCTYYTDEGWKLIQWFADSREAERDVLTSFFEFLKNYTTLIHFNGDGFDIPYLQKRCRAFSLPYDFSGIKSIDIYKKIKPFRRLLNLENLKQKTIERFLGVFRQDQYSGGQLIEVYHDFLLTRHQALYDMLMLHNVEDLQGMPLILPILNYPDFLEHPLTLTGQTILEACDLFGTKEYSLQLSCVSDCEIPVPFEQETTIIRFEAQGHAITFTIRLYDGELRYFHPNYKDYYYLPFEDTAIHKSVGEFVEKSARTRATAKNCYTKKKGRFLPQYEVIWEPALKKECKDKLTYTDYQESLFDDSSVLNTYLGQLLSALLSSSR